FLLSVYLFSVLFFFFFQAEDGIRDFHVTGVQTCALPIFAWFAGWACAISGPGPIPHVPTAKPNASSRPACASGHTPAAMRVPSNEPLTCCRGCTTTTGTDHTPALATTHPSAAYHFHLTTYWVYTASPSRDSCPPYGRMLLQYNLCGREADITCSMWQRHWSIAGTTGSWLARRRPHACRPGPGLCPGSTAFSA